MASQAWLDSSLRRSARLGREVLDRASRRSVDWTSSGSRSGSARTPASSEGAGPSRAAGEALAAAELADAFASISEFMARTTDRCRSFYESGSCPEPSDAERRHVCRFHAGPGPDGASTRRPGRKHGGVSGGGEDFYIEVSPGTYSVTASCPESQRQTRLVRVEPGESVSLTFDL
ncbi:A-kinase-interacting protein 1 [Cololabis saira]|uniref:A-kinase-interacting protein 1 n=1 Tax=Cololabis saira TaxID=129043 RepID=UPI002AD4B4B0|nr:A-kinase-interacting protein 1 [Cololabis saira]